MSRTSAKQVGRPCAGSKMVSPEAAQARQRDGYQSPQRQILSLLPSL
ncbi:hypothetical protein [Streptomyces sp. NBC_00690]|nr:hypothetical protein [Streptomyces sp. NBC_00690]